MTSQNVPMEGGVEQSMPPFTDQYMDVCSAGGDPWWIGAVAASWVVLVFAFVCVTLYARSLRG